MCPVLPDVPKDCADGICTIFATLDDLRRNEGDNPTLGIVLCAETDEDIARYSVLHDSEQLFASKYKLYLPDEDELRAEIEAQKRIFRAQQEERGDELLG